MHDGLAWLSQILMFLMLGLLITPSRLLPILWDGSLIALGLMLLARPIAVFISLLPFHFPWREQVFISWVGLRGAVPMILAIIPLTAGIEKADLFFHIAFFVVLSSLVLQGWTIPPVARLLKVEIPPVTGARQRFNLDAPGPADREIASYEVAKGSGVAGACVPGTSSTSSPNQARPPPSTTCSIRSAGPRAWTSGPSTASSRSTRQRAWPMLPRPTGCR